MKKGPWSAGEDKILSEYVRVHGEGNWNAVQRSTSLDRCGKSCRLRWANHLRPNLKKGSFSPHEERLIIDLHSSLGNKWARISAHLPGRTDNEVKNYWNTRVKRRLRQGLPLYPNNNNNNHHVPPPSSPPPPPPMPNLKTPPSSSVSFFDPASLPFPPPFFSFNQAPPLSLPKWIHPTSSFLFGSDFIPSVQAHAETEPSGLGLGLGFGFQSVLDLPSNQFRPNLGLLDHDDDDDDEYEAIDEANFDPNVYGRRSDNSGLLDALLQEAQSRAEASASKSSLKNNNDCLDCDQWDSLFGYSSTGMGKMEDSEDDKDYKNEDLSSILNLIPSLVTAPKWKQEAEEACAGKSDEIAGFDLPQFPNISSSSNNTEWLNSSGSWENLPMIS